MANVRSRSTSRRRAASRAPRGRRSRARRVASIWRSLRRRRLPSVRSPTPAERDVLGLGLIAIGVFLAFVLYGGGNGGRAGHGLVVALGWTLGKARAFAPIALIAAGGALLLRAVLPPVGRLRAGTLCLFASVTLALAAGTLGVS